MFLYGKKIKGVQMIFFFVKNPSKLKEFFLNGGGGGGLDPLDTLLAIHLILTYEKASLKLIPKFPKLYSIQNGKILKI